MDSGIDYEYLVWGYTLWGYLSGVGFTVLNYDYLLTLGEEMRLVWPGALSFPKVLFYSIRYLSLVDGIIATYGAISTIRPPVTVRLSVYLAGIAYSVRTSATTGMLCMRLAALHKDARWVIRLLWVGFVISAGTRSVLTFWASITSDFNAVYDPQTNQCYAVTTTGAVGSAWFVATTLSIPMTLDIFLLILTITKAVKSATLAKSHPSSLIMRTLVRHELVYFFVICTVRITNSVFWLTFPQAFKSVFESIEGGVEVSLISRFFLHLRSVFHSSQPKEESGSLPSAVRTRSIWKRMDGFITDFSVGLGEETSTREEIPHAQTVSLHAAMELRTRHDGDEDGIKLAADGAPEDDK